MNISINAQEFQIKESISLADVLIDYSLKKHIKGSFAVALNSKFIAKGHYAKTILNAGDKIDIMSPIAGG
ncbi:sulfur carrier protein ThiS [Pseudoalteromonas denitrificans]|uniref:Sulfur carrier protein n=1 Tax=Pseudoalteromonas denitrificans DSM 6059 TaxID=1123010 RepID=A0A1I1K072_9GAMM|nr:sulfur carrier protein ThiS [Pseudoalteromonas denitrificans]SFC54136.1 sulfur carrier protein [Pseudoalteromonas denitrificans DSM 6059]